jgi:hypothetical protein
LAEARREVEGLPDFTCIHETEPWITKSAVLSIIDSLAPAGLDAAWAEAEAALPEGWVLELATPNPHEPRPTHRAEAWNGNGGVTRGYVKADEIGPAAALRALAVRLTAESGEPQHGPNCDADLRKDGCVCVPG